MSAAAQDPQIKANGSVLIIDDDGQALELLADALTAEGYDVQAAGSGEMALATIASQLPHLILLDLRLPGIDGFEVCRRLKANERTRDIPVIFLSAAGAVKERVEGLAQGAVDFVVKPFRREELLARVRTHMELGRLRTGLEQQVAQRTADLRDAVEQLKVEVAERKRVEAAMRETEELTFLAMQAGRTYAFDWNPTTNEVRRSHSSADILGIKGDATRDTWTHCMQRVHAEDREKLQRRIAELTPEHDTGECDYRMIGPDGRVVYLHAIIRAMFDENGRAVRYIGIVADATRIRLAEEALHESEDRFRNMADTAPLMICASGPDKLATYFNRAWLSFTGRTLEQELGYGWKAGIHPEDLERTTKNYFACFDARRKCHLEYRLRRADGEYRWVVCSGVPRKSADGTFAGYIGSCIDITDLKRAQEEAFDKQKLESLRVLTGGIAHDFNNLLGGILVETELAETEIQEGGSPMTAVRRIRSVATRASEIVRELLVYSGQDKATLESVDVSRVVEEMLELLKISISKHATLQADLAKKLPAVLGNTTQIRQVVMNLIINASEALGDMDGTIRLATSKTTVLDEPGVENAAGLPEGEYVRLEISDTGAGMTEEAKNRIFEPFFTTKSAGHGLGLAVVQGIVRSHGGGVNVTSVPGHGTMFEVLLPCAGDLTGRGLPATPASATNPGAANPQTILLVENEDTLRISVAKALRRRGYSVLSAADGAAALDIFREHAQNIHAVVLDLALPGLSYREAARQIHAIHPSATVILTGARDPGEKRGADSGDRKELSFLRKPYRIGELVRYLGKAAPKPSSDTAEASQSDTAKNENASTSY